MGIFDSIGNIVRGQLIDVIEWMMCYPPGIPILAPGERITAEILDYIEYAKAKGCNMTGPEDPDILRLNVLTGRE